MNIKSFLSIFLFGAVMVLVGCQSEKEQEELAPKRVITVKASLPGSTESRATVTYGYYEDRSKEVFTWSNTDYITVFNITRFRDMYSINSENSENTSGDETKMLYLDIAKIDGKNAEFQTPSEYDADYPIRKGDVLFIILGAATPANPDIARVKTDNLISYLAVISDARASQKIVPNPETNPSALSHLNDQLRMYAIVTVEEDDVIPDFTFTHLSAIMRVTLRNETGKPLFDKNSDIVFSYPTGDNCAFIYGFSYVCVAQNDAGEYYLMENFKAPIESNPTTIHTYQATHKINYSTASSGPRVPLENGDTYEFYAIVAPTVGEQPIGKELIIDLYDGTASSYGVPGYDCEKYSITIDDFGRAIAPGKRFWFNLTAVREEVDGKTETKLMLTNAWKALHPEAAEN